MEFWKKFYTCDCICEGIMISYEMERNGIPLASFAYWSEGQVKEKMRIRDRIRWCWKILTTGKVWNDMVELNQETAKELGEDLLKFANKEYGLNR